ncbi:MAG TPA: hypothetical protein VEC36_06465 [Patescibacteria group bacterium]|nr:hypothetical protein [Patescibacteria group bacterium]
MRKVAFTLFALLLSAPLVKAQVYLMCDTEFEYPAMARRARITGNSSIHFNIENGTPKIINVEASQPLLKEISIKNLSKLRFLKDSNNSRVTFIYELRKNINRSYTEYLGDTIKIEERDCCVSKTILDHRELDISSDGDTVFYHKHLRVNFLIPEKPEILLKMNTNNTFTILKNNYPQFLKEELLLKESQGIAKRKREYLDETYTPKVQIVRFLLLSEVPECNYYKSSYDFK